MNRAVAGRIYESIDGERTLAEILLHAHASEFLVLKLLFRLHQLGLRRGRRDPPPQPALEDASRSAAGQEPPSSPAAELSRIEFDRLPGRWTSRTRSKPSLSAEASAELPDENEARGHRGRGGAATDPPAESTERRSSCSTHRTVRIPARTICGA